jgi:hypothetical protein
MSDRTPCNYCNLEWFKRQYPGQTILLKATNDRYVSGDPPEPLPEMIAVTVEGSEKHLALMDTIPSRCCC